MILDGNTKNVEITVPIKCFSNFRRTLEMPFINYEINLMKIVLFFCQRGSNVCNNTYQTLCSRYKYID